VQTVVLVGLMGSGKSTVGALVAARTDRLFVDVDIVIARETGKTVRELWEQGGEAAYRELESAVVLKVLADDTPSVLAAPGGVVLEVLRDDMPTVLAAPGGVVLDPLVRAALADCVVVWLRTSPSTLAGRVRPGDHRPLLGDEPVQTFATMAEMRSELYRQVATAIIDTDGRAPEAIADEVEGLLGSNPEEP
jgi:shikimate kinase